MKNWSGRQKVAASILIEREAADTYLLFVVGEFTLLVLLLDFVVIHSESDSVSLSFGRSSSSARFCSALRFFFSRTHEWNRDRHESAAAVRLTELLASLATSMCEGVSWSCFHCWLIFLGIPWKSSPEALIAAPHMKYSKCSENCAAGKLLSPSPCGEGGGGGRGGFGVGWGASSAGLYQVLSRAAVDKSHKIPAVLECFYVLNCKNDQDLSAETEYTIVGV